MKEGEEQDNPTLFEIMKDDPHMTYNDATKVQEEARLVKEAKAANEKEGVKKYQTQNRPLTDTMDERAYYELKNENQRLKKRVDEAEGEMTIVKGIGINSPEMKEAKHRVKELENSLSIALEINESHQRYNGKLQTRVTDLEEDNKKLTKQISDHIKKYEDVFRKAGM